MKIEIWSDVVCPFCYIGKRHLEAALESFAHRDEVEIIWRSFELDPGAERDQSGTVVDRLARKYGTSQAQAEAMLTNVTARAAAVGLAYNLRESVPTNTFDAHRAIHLAASHGLQDEAEEKLMDAYFTKAAHVGDPETLVKLMSEIGIPEGKTRAVLAGDTHGDAVRADEQEAQALGIEGVPFFVFNRKYAISGAQPVELFADVLAKTWDESSQ
jgi:predicted DsbA family dithiol-disulfide isomerase